MHAAYTSGEWKKTAVIERILPNVSNAFTFNSFSTKMKSPTSCTPTTCRKIFHGKPSSRSRSRQSQVGRSRGPGRHRWEVKVEALVDTPGNTGQAKPPTSGEWTVSARVPTHAPEVKGVTRYNHWGREKGRDWGRRGGARGEGRRGYYRVVAFYVLRVRFSNLRWEQWGHWDRIPLATHWSYLYSCAHPSRLHTVLSTATLWNSKTPHHSTLCVFAFAPRNSSNFDTMREDGWGRPGRWLAVSPVSETCAATKNVQLAAMPSQVCFCFCFKFLFIPNLHRICQRLWSVSSSLALH